MLHGKIPPSAIMDRNLGALDDTYSGSTGRGGKYFQFGRKDPFNAYIHCWSYDPQTFIPIKTASANGLRTIISRTLIDSLEPGGSGTEGHNVPFSVNSPTIYITGMEWSSTTDIFGGTKLEDNKTTKFWNDPRPFIRIENEEKNAVNENKSFFDPCPLGWRLPVKGWVSGFRGDASGSATGDVNMNFQWGVDSEFRNKGNGRTYIPLGYLSQKGKQNAQTVFFPASGSMGFFNGSLGVGGGGASWTSSPCGDISNGNNMDFSASNFNSNNDSYRRGYGCSIRCLRE